MKNAKVLFQVAVCAAAILVMTSPVARADVTGTIWEIPGFTTNAPAVDPSGPGVISEGTFAALGINFNVPSGTGTLSTYLTSGGATAITVSAAVLAAPMSSSVAVAGVNPGPYSTIIRFNENVNLVNGTTYHVTHDDGIVLYINGGIVINAPLPTSPISSSFVYTGATGVATLAMYYDECCGNPGVTQTDMPQAAVPEPASILLLGTTFLGVSGLLRKALRRA